MPKTIKINFADFFTGFNKKNNVYYNLLAKHYNVEISENPEFLFYSVHNVTWMRYGNCIKIFCSGENTIPNFNECDYSIGYNYLDYDGRHHRISRYCQRLPFDERDYFNRKFCNFIYSNTGRGQGAILRKEFCEKLQKYRPVDCPGRALNNMKEAIIPRNGDWARGKAEFIKNYKFTIAFENTGTPGYATEKIVQPLICNSVPIYWGDPEITREFNPEAFVNCRDFANFDEVIKYVKYLDANENAYMNMLQAAPMRDDYRPEEHDLEKFLVHIIEHGAKVNREPFDFSIQRYVNYLTLPETKDAPMSGIDPRAGVPDNLKRFFKNTPFLFDHPYILEYLHKILVSAFANQMIDSQSGYQAVTGAWGQELYDRALFLNGMRMAGKKAVLTSDLSGMAAWRELLLSLWPMVQRGRRKIRIGPNDWQGRVLLEPAKDDIIYSFFWPNHSLWGLELAQKGHTVFQFSERFSQAPHEHANLVYFHKKLLPEEKKAENGATLMEIMSSLGHSENRNLILHLDLEGREWEILKSLPEKVLSQFNQIVIEFHNLTDFTLLESHGKIFAKILKSHYVTHLHYNNNGRIMAGADFSRPELLFLMSDLLEISFVRKDLDEFKPSVGKFPTELDYPSVPRYPDVPIQDFGAISAPPKACASNTAAAPLQSCAKLPPQNNPSASSAFRRFPLAGKKCVIFGAPDWHPADIDSQNATYAPAGREVAAASFDAAILPVVSKSASPSLKDMLAKASQALKPDGNIYLPLNIGDFPDAYKPAELCGIIGDLAFLGAYGTAAGSGDAPIWFVLSKNLLAVAPPPETDAAQKQIIAFLAESGEFERNFYIETYPEVLLEPMDAISHYFLAGAKRNLKPASWFDPAKASHPAAFPDANPFLFYLHPEIYLR